MDWQQIIIELESIGMTQLEIALISESSPGLISDIKNGRRGKRLSFDIGIRLTNLWNEKKEQIELLKVETEKLQNEYVQ